VLIINFERKVIVISQSFRSKYEISLEGKKHIIFYHFKLMSDQNIEQTKRLRLMSVLKKAESGENVNNKKISFQSEG
jgi:hypothetical protein